MKALKIISEDRIGLLSDVSETLGKSKINIEEVAADRLGSNAMMTLFVKDLDREKASKLLSRKGFSVVEEDVIIIQIDDKPGELARVMRIMKDHQINVNKVTTIAKESRKAVLAINVDKQGKAKRLLKEWMKF